MALFPLLRRLPRASKLHHQPQLPTLYLRRCCSSTAPPVAATTLTPAAHKPARTRFAPSPTGFLHLGSLRTALFNYLLAKSTGGKFLLRVEDTDAKRTVVGAEDSLYETLRWAGLKWDEGPLVSGPHAPYKQSERSALHQSHAQRLLDDSHAYRCFCPPSRLAALSIARKKQNLPTDYDRTCAHLTQAEIDAQLAVGTPYVIRLKAPAAYPAFQDLVYGTIKFGDNTVAQASGSYEDPILLKSDGSPTYHLANVVDDHHMQITHVVRATEWMPSTPKHVYLYQCFGWEPPAFVHVGLLQDGKHKKLSKRTGDVFVSEYREKGYLPQALNNFVALLGWSHDRESDVMGLEELVKAFDVKRLTQGNTVVDYGKLDFLQKHHARLVFEAGGEGREEMLRKVEEKIYERFGEKLETGAPITKEYIEQVLTVNLGNYLLPATFPDVSAYFFNAPSEEQYPPKVMRKIQKYLDESKITYPELFAPILAELKRPIDEEGVCRTGEDWKRYLVDNGDKDRWMSLMRALRVALAGGEAGPAIGEVLEVIGRERAVERVEKMCSQQQSQ